MLIKCKIDKNTSHCKRLYSSLKIISMFCVASNVALQMLDNASVDAYSKLEWIYKRDNTKIYISIVFAEAYSFYSRVVSVFCQITWEG